MKRVVFNALAAIAVLALAVAMTSAPATADTIDIAIAATSPAGTWSFVSGGPLTMTTATNAGITFVDQTNGNTYAVAGGGQLILTTGNETSTPGCTTCLFGPNTSSTAITIKSGSTVLFSGEVGVTELQSGVLNLIANFVGGQFGASVLTALSATPGVYTGTVTTPITVALLNSNAGNGSLGSTDATLASPEPGTLVMFGSGLLGLAGILRRKLKV
jgi:PEP-CTERM motif